MPEEILTSLPKGDSDKQEAKKEKTTSTAKEYAEAILEVYSSDKRYSGLLEE